jgi:hypothetical protein
MNFLGFAGDAKHAHVDELDNFHSFTIKIIVLNQFLITILASRELESSFPSLRDGRSRLRINLRNYVGR